MVGTTLNGGGGGGGVDTIRDILSSNINYHGTDIITEDQAIRARAARGSVRVGARASH